MSDDSDSTNRRTVLRGLAAGVSVGGMTGTATASSTAATTVREEVADPESLFADVAETTLESVAEAGILESATLDALSFESRSPEELFAGGEGVASFSLEPEGVGESRRVSVATRQVSAGQLRLWIDRDGDFSYAVLVTDDGRQRFTSDVASSDVTTSDCSDFCDYEQCGNCEGRFYEVTEVSGTCFVEEKSCSCTCLE